MMSTNATAQKTAVKRGRSQARNLVHKKKKGKGDDGVYSKENV